MSTAKAASTTKDTQPVGRVVRINISPAAWRTLRHQAVERDMPMTEFVGSILEREAKTKAEKGRR